MDQRLQQQAERHPAEVQGPEARLVHPRDQAGHVRPDAQEEGVHRREGPAAQQRAETEDGLRRPHRWDATGLQGHRCQLPQADPLEGRLRQGYRVPARPEGGPSQVPCRPQYRERLQVDARGGVLHRGRGAQRPDQRALPRDRHPARHGREQPDPDTQRVRGVREEGEQRPPGNAADAGLLHPDPEGHKALPGQ